MNDHDGEELMLKSFSDRRTFNQLIESYQATRDEKMFREIVAKIQPFMDRLHEVCKETSFEEMEEIIREEALKFEYEGMSFNTRVYSILNFYRKRLQNA